jgi:A/G-specific adenine glycosylase
VLSRALFCLAHGRVDSLPAKPGKSTYAKQVFQLPGIISGFGWSNIYLASSEGNDIWKGLYDFPMIETSSNRFFILIKP